MATATHIHELALCKGSSDRFNQHWIPEPNSGCWLWLAGAGKRRYGRFKLGKLPNGKSVTRFAHRVSWQIHRGEIPKGIQVCHKCDVPECVNPDHLFLGTQKDNARDMARKRRASRQAQLTDEQINAIRNDRRFSRIIGTEYGISAYVVRDIRTGRRGRWAETGDARFRRSDNRHERT